MYRFFYPRKRHPMNFSAQYLRIARQGSALGLVSLMLVALLVSTTIASDRDDVRPWHEGTRGAQYRSTTQLFGERTGLVLFAFAGCGTAAENPRSRAPWNSHDGIATRCGFR